MGLIQYTLFLVGKYEKGQHSNLRLKILLGDDVVGYLLLAPIKWKIEPPSHGKEWAEIKIGEIMEAIKKIENGQKPDKIKIAISSFQTKAIDVWVDNKTKDLFVKFADGKIKKLNMVDALEGLENTWAGEILKSDLFDKVTIKNGMPTWPNEFDFDTDTIYDYGIDVSNTEKKVGASQR